MYFLLGCAVVAGAAITALCMGKLQMQAIIKDHPLKGAVKKRVQHLFVVVNNNKAAWSPPRRSCFEVDNDQDFYVAEEENNKDQSVDV